MSQASYYVYKILKDNSKRWCLSPKLLCITCVVAAHCNSKCDK